MHRRCCWPPESAERALFEPVLDLVPERRAAGAPARPARRGRPSSRGCAARTRRCRRSTSGTGSASGRPCRCGGAPRPGRRSGRRGRCRGRGPAPPRRAGDQVVHAVETAQERALAAARRPDERGDVVLVDVERRLAKRDRAPDKRHRQGSLSKTTSRETGSFAAPAPAATSPMRRPSTAGAADVSSTTVTSTLSC